MDWEIVVAVVAVFVSGGAIGTAGTLLTQWLLRGIGNRATSPDHLPATRELARLRSELRALGRQVHNMDERLEFQEQLLSGANPTRTPPRRLAEDAGDEETGDHVGETGIGDTGNGTPDGADGPPSPGV